MDINFIFSINKILILYKIKLMILLNEIIANITLQNPRKPNSKVCPTLNIVFHYYIVNSLFGVKVCIYSFVDYRAPSNFLPV